MFVDRLINQTNAPLAEQMLRFAQRRHAVLAENVANLSVPSYQPRDLSQAHFQAQLRTRLAERARQPVGSVSFDDLAAQIGRPDNGLLFHDRATRSVEKLMSDVADNALRHNLYSELMRKSLGSLQDALRERVT